MDALHEQVDSLNVRMDALHQTIERLSKKVSEILAEVKASTKNGNNRFQSGVSLGQSSYQYRNDLHAVMEHKDVLMDMNYPDSDNQNGERSLAPDVQIQRLTAQLTAAYNRIAALEEQLLSRRIH
jgi:chaperonin cofactor prefoldin